MNLDRPGVGLTSNVEFTLNTEWLKVQVLPIRTRFKVTILLTLPGPYGNSWDILIRSLGRILIRSKDLAINMNKCKLFIRYYDACLENLHKLNLFPKLSLVAKEVVKSHWYFYNYLREWSDSANAFLRAFNLDRTLLFVVLFLLVSSDNGTWVRPERVQI
jgi:hypothetical protein